MLGLKKNEIENAEISADTKNVQLTARSVLYHWRSTKGSDATKGAILEALTKCKYKEAVQTLSKEWNIFLNTQGMQFFKKKENVVKICSQRNCTLNQN